MNNTVIIPTVGLGSRLGALTTELNKSLVSFRDKPILGHIIEQFPADTKFLIPVGNKAQQVKDFCSLAYPDRNIIYIEIDDWTSKKSGTAHTLRSCKDFITGPFWYVTCDTYFDEDILQEKFNTDCYFTKHVDESEHVSYTLFELDNNTITDIKIKVPCPTNWVAFTGLMYIAKWGTFFKTLQDTDTTEFVDIIKAGDITRPLETWKDFGNLDAYKNNITSDTFFDFSKYTERTYICNGRVIKWWNSNVIPEQKAVKPTLRPHLFPDDLQTKNNWQSYKFVEGKTLYANNDFTIFTALLSWLETRVWPSVSTFDITSICHTFYKTKTLERISKFLLKHPMLPEINYIDGLAVKPYTHYLANIDWDLLSKTHMTAFNHGDLQFDNIIVTNDAQFKLIDWRPEFAGLYSAGDIYYDFAKMLGGFYLDYSKIKQNQFSVTVEGDAVNLVVPHIDDFEQYRSTLKEFIIGRGYDYAKVQTLVPLIFWNMAPLHHEPFATFLWYYGMKLFEMGDV